MAEHFHWLEEETYVSEDKITAPLMSEMIKLSIDIEVITFDIGMLYYCKGYILWPQGSW